MHIDIISLFPDMFSALDYSIIGRAQQQGLLKLNYWNPRDFTHDRHKVVDDKPYGGGPGMLMKVQPLCDAIQMAKSQMAKTATGQTAKVICLSPQGQVLDQDKAVRLAQETQLILVAGRYEGIDQRLLATEVDVELSLGDFILSGGELAAMALIDCIARLLPGVLGAQDSAKCESFMHGLLEHPHYTRPEEINGMRVPKVLLSGDHQTIANWRLQQALGRTWQRRPDLLAKRPLTRNEKTLLDQFIEEQQTGAA